MSSCISFLIYSLPISVWFTHCAKYAASSCSRCISVMFRVCFSWLPNSHFCIRKWVETDCFGFVCLFIKKKHSSQQITYYALSFCHHLSILKFLKPFPPLLNIRPRYTIACIYSSLLLFTLHSFSLMFSQTFVFQPIIHRSILQHAICDNAVSHSCS